MTIDELIELAEDARVDLGGDAQIRIAYQPGGNTSDSQATAVSWKSSPPGGWTWDGQFGDKYESISRW